MTWCTAVPYLTIRQSIRRFEGRGGKAGCLEFSNTGKYDVCYFSFFLGFDLIRFDSIRFDLICRPGWGNEEGEGGDFLDFYYSSIRVTIPVVMPVSSLINGRDGGGEVIGASGNP